MQITEDSIDPRLEPGIFPNHYESADAAFDAGNYAQAFLSAGAASTEIGALAAIMCGAVALGLKNLGAPKDDRARLAAAYGRWSLGDADAALAHLGVITNGAYDGPAGRLREMISAPSIAAAVITMPGGEKGRAFADAAGFKVTEISVGPNDFGTPWPDIWEQAGGGEGPRLIIGIDAFGPYLPPGLYQQPAPVALWSSDHDFFLATRHHDHASADLIIVNAAGECAEMSEFYGGRVASLPGHDTYAQGFGARNGRARDVDILFTGRVFASYMRDKAQFLFRLACLEDAALKIEFLNGYLGEEEYAERIAGARFVPTTWRYPGGIQTRCVDAFRGGARVLESDAQSLGGLLGYDRDWFVNASDGVVREIPETDAAMDADLDALFWPSPEREERFLKFCLFQSLFTGERPLHRAPAAIPVELRGYMREPGLQVYTRIASLNAREPGSAADYNYAAAAAFYAAILVPEKSELTELAGQIYRTGVETFPGNLVLRFNAASVQWSVGLKGEASANFMAVIDRESELEFDATKDALISHRVRAISDLFPFGDYHAACAGHDSGGANPRSILKCAAMTFLGADALDEGRIDQAIELLEAAALLFGRSAPVWRLLARARLADGSDAAAVRQAFYRAVNLYPGELPGLLEIGLEAELADGRSDQAADILRKWTLLASRVTSEDGQGYGISPETLAVAQTHCGLLGDWTRSRLDSILSADQD